MAFGKKSALKTPSTGWRAAPEADPVYPAEAAGPQRPWLPRVGMLVALAIALPVAAMTVLTTNGGWPQHHVASASSTDLSRFDDELSQRTSLVRLQAALRRHYPGAGAGMDRAVAAARLNGDTRAAIVAIVQTAAGALNEDLHHLKHAGGPALLNWSRKMQAFSEVESRRTGAGCNPLDALPALRAGTAGEALEEAIAEFQLATIEGVHIGRTAPVRVEAPTRSDNELLNGYILAHGVRADELVAPSSAASLASSRECQLAIIVFQSMHRMPEPARTRMLSYVASRMTRN
jgi:hypothetical protein